MINLDELIEDWHSVARYSVYRTQGFASQRAEVKTILHRDQTYEQALAKISVAEIALRQEPGYDAVKMSRPLIGLELEKPVETRAAYLIRRRARQQEEENRTSEV